MSRTTRRAATIAVVAALATGSIGGSAIAQDQVLRVAMGSPGEAGIAVWDEVAAQFEATHPGVDMKMDYQNDDLYQTIGLPQLLAGPNARTSTSSGPAAGWRSDTPTATRRT